MAKRIISCARNARRCGHDETQKNKGSRAARVSRNVKKSVAAIFLFFALFTARTARADHEPVFPIDIAVTSDENGAVVDRAWLDREMAIAERIFGALAVHVRIDRVRPLGTELARIEDPRMRDRFAPLVTAHRVQVFIVRSLRDNVEIGVYRGGVTWDSIPSAQNGPSRRFVILAANAAESSLAHELGHFFGIQPHSSTKNNLMSYDRDDALVFLDATQKALVRERTRALRTGGAITITDFVDP